jgi:hypothetical protein
MTKKLLTLTTIFITTVAGCPNIDRAADPTPAPAQGKQFTLPLADDTQANAAIVATAPGQALLFYATQRGQLAWYTLSQQSPPGPGPTPPPPPPPPPPQPTKLSIAIVTDPATLTPAQAAVALDRTWRDYAARNHTLIGCIPNNIIEKESGKAPAALQPFLAAIATESLPRLIGLDVSGRKLLDIPLPTTSAAIIAALTPFTNPKHHDP